MALKEKVCGVVAGVQFSPGWTELWLNVGEDTGGPANVIVETDGQDCKLTINGQPATVAQVLAFLFAQRAPKMTGTRSAQHYGAITVADFTS